jgi:hypothetical protein
VHYKEKGGEDKASEMGGKGDRVGEFNGLERGTEGQGYRGQGRIEME